MKTKTISIILISMILLAVALVTAIDFNPNGDIDLHEIWKIKNATEIYTHNISILGSINGANNKILISGENITAGTINISRLPNLNDSYYLNCENITGSAGSLCQNQTQNSFNNFNSTWDNSWVNIYAYNHTFIANNYTDSKLITTFYNASYVNNITGITQGSLSDINIYDSISYNVSEVNSDMDFRVNFTGITEFNQIIVRYKSDLIEYHTMTIDLWNYDTSAWESYRTIGSSPDYNIMTMAVFDEAEHISGGIVQVRFYTNNVGASTHKHYFDWVSISKGTATPSSSETDPYSIHKDGSVALTGNWNAGSYNITADNFDAKWKNISYINVTQIQNNEGILTILTSWLTSLFYEKSQVYNKTEIDAFNFTANGTGTGSSFNATYDIHVNNLTLHNQTLVYNHTLISENYANSNFYNKSSNISWNVLDSFPIACPTGSFVSQLGNSVVCSVPTLFNGNLNMNRNNITNVSYVNYANATSTTAWRSYVNASNSFIIEVSA